MFDRGATVVLKYQVGLQASMKALGFPIERVSCCRVVMLRKDYGVMKYQFEKVFLTQMLMNFSMLVLRRHLS